MEGFAALVKLHGGVKTVFNAGAVLENEKGTPRMALQYGAMYVAFVLLSRCTILCFLYFRRLLTKYDFKILNAGKYSQSSKQPDHWRRELVTRGTRHGVFSHRLSSGTLSNIGLARYISHHTPENDDTS